MHRHYLWFVMIMMIVAAGCAAAAGFISTATWTDWFSHPAQTRPELTRQGAELWRILLGVTAATLLVVPFILIRLSPPTDMRPAASTPSRTRVWLLIGFVIIGLALRATRLNESLWYDEIASWMTYAGGITSIGAAIGNFFDPINHPFHTLLNVLSVRWLSDSLGVETAFRLPSLLFSLLSIVAMFGLGRAAIGERAGFFAAFLTAVLPVSVLEIEARGYSMMICFAALMTWLLIEARRRHYPWWWFAYAVACALGTWSHFVTAFVPIGHAVWLSWRAVRHREWREAASGLLALIAAAAVTITLYSSMIPAMLASRGMFVAARADQPTIIGVEGLHALLEFGGSWYWWAAVPGLALVLIGLIAMAFNRRSLNDDAESPRSSASHAVELALIGLPLMLTVVALSGTWVYARFMLFALPGAIMLMTIGIETLWRWRREAAAAATVIIIGLSVTEVVLRPPKQPLRDAADYVRTHRAPDDRILVIGLAHEVLRIYINDLNPSYSMRHGAELPSKLTNVRPQWIIVEYPDSVTRETHAILQHAKFKKVADFPGWVDWTNGHVIVYRKE